MAPSVHSVVTSRLLSTALSLNKALKKAASLPGFSPSQGYFYKNENNPITFTAGGGGGGGSAGSGNGSTSSSSFNTAGKHPQSSGTRSMVATPISTGPTGTPSAGPPSSSASGGAANNAGSAANGGNLPLTAATERQAFYNIDRALSYSVSNTTMYIDDPVPTSSTNSTAAAGAVPGTGTGGSTGQALTASQVPAVAGNAAASLSASPSSTDLKAKAALNNQATTKRRRKPLR